MFHVAVIALVFLLASPMAVSRAFAQAKPGEEIMEVTQVWSGQPVGICLLTEAPDQFLAFYDADENMTVASRILDATHWTFVRLPEKLGWDSHNYVTMTMDDDGYIHLSGNMHCVPLVYFRTQKPRDITTFERIPSMIGDRETRCTYPQFMRGPSNELIFTYRDGRSGSGDQIYNVYNHSARKWERLLDQPLLSGKGLMNAYLNGPVKGPDGFYHLCWVWRNSGGCETNHDLSYARSKHLRHWETSAGKPLELPMTIDTAEIVDPVPPKGGIINGNTKLGFDSKNRPVISYHKYDELGFTQIYAARLEDGKWIIRKISNWDYRWQFEGGGSIIFEIGLGSVRSIGDGKLVQDYNHKKYGPGRWILEEENLSVISDEPKKSESKVAPPVVHSASPEMEPRSCGDSGKNQEPGDFYALHWKTMPPNRDRPRGGGPPLPSMLRLHKTKN